MSYRESTVGGVSPQRVIRPAARRSPAGAGSLLWTAAAAALPVIVVVLVLVVLTLAVLVFSDTGFDSLFAVVAVEWLVVNRVPLTVDAVELGFLPLLPPLIYVAVLARQTRAVLADVEQPGGREAGAAVAGATVAGLLLTGLASLLVGSAASDFAVREYSLPVALLWTAAVGLTGSGLGVWLFFRRELREVIPLWVRGGIHLGAAFTAATWAVAAFMVLVGILFAWEPVAESLEIGKGLVGIAALAGISAAYLPNVVIAASALLVGGEAHLGEASYSVFAVSRGPMPEVPLAAALPTTDPHWVVQALLLVTVLVAAGLSRSVAHWFRTTADAVKAVWVGAAVVAVVMAVTPVVAGGQLGVLGSVGTGSLIAAVMALLLFGIIGSTTIALSLAGLTRRRERAESELARRRRRVGAVPEAVSEVGDNEDHGDHAGRDDWDDDTDDYDDESDHHDDEFTHHATVTAVPTDTDADPEVDTDPDAHETQQMPAGDHPVVEHAEDDDPNEDDTAENDTAEDDTVAGEGGQEAGGQVDAPSGVTVADADVDADVPDSVIRDSATAGAESPGAASPDTESAEADSLDSGIPEIDLGEHLEGGSSDLPDDGRGAGD